MAKLQEESATTASRLSTSQKQLKMKQKFQKTGVPRASLNRPWRARAQLLMPLRRNILQTIHLDFFIKLHCLHIFLWYKEMFHCRLH